MQVRHERELRIFLRVMGLVSFSAIFAVFMPYDWMNYIHQYLGMGDLPSEPIVGYLARSLSAFYAFFGLMALLVSFDIERYIVIIRVMGASTLVLGGILVWVDFMEGLPARWAFAEGPFDILIGIVILWFSRNSDVKDTK